MTEQAEKFEVVTTAQVERTYTVLASDEDQAHKRLRTFLRDPDMLREELVTEHKEKQIDRTTQKVKSNKKVSKPRAARTRPAVSKATEPAPAPAASEPPVAEVA